MEGKRKIGANKNYTMVSTPALKAPNTASLKQPQHWRIIPCHVASLRQGIQY